MTLPVLIKLSNVVLESPLILKVKAPDDGETLVPAEVDLTKINVHVDVDHNNKIQLTKDAGVIMTYPTIDMFMGSNLQNPSTEEMLGIKPSIVLQTKDQFKVE